MNSLVQQLNDDLASVAQTVRHSLVQITNRRGSVGAGTIWRSDGLIVTNAHVVTGRHTLQATLATGETYPARVLAASESLDLAAVMIEADNLPTIELGDSRQLRPGQWVMSMGHPWGILNAVTGGIIISMGRRLGDIEFQNEQDWIAVNLKLRPGHSGGPLVDAQGHLLGVNTIMNGPEVGIAIPVHVVKGFLKTQLGSKEKVAAAV